MLVVLLLTTGRSWAQQPSAGGSGLDLSALDRTVNACTDFYQFACGGWIAANPVPADRQRWSRFAELQERNFERLRHILETPAAGGDRQKAVAYYAACMDEGGIEAKGLVPLEADLRSITTLRRVGDLPELLARLHGLGASALFRFSGDVNLRDSAHHMADVDQSGLGLPERDYYLKTDNRSVDLRTRYRAHVQRMLALADSSAPDALARSEKGADVVLALETALATASLDVVTRRDPKASDHPMTLAELEALAPNFGWKRYFTAAMAPPFQIVNVDAPEFVRGLGTLLASTPLDDLKIYLRWHVLRASAALLPKAFVEEDFDFFARTLAGQQQPLPRWRRCVARTDQALGEALGKAFVDEAFGPTAKADTLRMVQGIKAAMTQDIAEATWMGPDTKRAAALKLEGVADRIGYPDKWRDYSALRVNREDALGNLQRAVAFDRQRRIAKIGELVDLGEWSMTPPTVNAYYSAVRNNINFPAGILQPPFYAAGRDAAVNYGAAGSVIGHELTHGFDDQGRKFDGTGNLRDWWTADDAKGYETRSSCIADQYSQYVVAGDLHVNGRLTLGENTADNGGARLALLAYLAGPGAPDRNPASAAAEMVDGFTPEQRFFLGFGQIWCESSRPEAERLLAATDPHTATRYRVNGVISNMPEFQKAFSCRADAPMVRANACRVW